MGDIRVFENTELLSQSAAAEFTRLATQSCLSRGVFLAALAGGGTPQRLYDLLAQAPYRDEIPWKKVHFFWGDERCVPPDHSESNFNQVVLSLAKKVSFLEENLHPIRGELTPKEAAEHYIFELQKWAAPGLTWPAFDYVLLGMGADGHTASLFPGSEPDPRQSVIAVTANYQGRPANRVTLTPRVFNSARSIHVLATGKNKAAILAAALQGKQDLVSLPIQRIRPDEGKMTWYIDEAAAEFLSK